MSIDEWDRFREVHRELTRNVEGYLLSAHQLRLVVYDALRALESAPDRSLIAGQLARRIGLSPGGTTRVLDELVRCGWARRERSTDDGRATVVVLTDQGADLCARVERGYDELINNQVMPSVYEQLGQLGDPAAV